MFNLIFINNLIKHYRIVCPPVVRTRACDDDYFHFKFAELVSFKIRFLWLIEPILIKNGAS